MKNDNSNTVVANKITSHGVVSSAYSATFCHDELNNIADLLAEIRIELDIRDDELLFDVRLSTEQKEWIKLKIDEILACYDRIEDLIFPPSADEKSRDVRLLSAVEGLASHCQRKEGGFVVAVRMLPVMTKLYAPPSLSSV